VLCSGGVATDGGGGDGTLSTVVAKEENENETERRPRRKRPQQSEAAAGDRKPPVMDRVPATNGAPVCGECQAPARFHCDECSGNMYCVDCGESADQSLVLLHFGVGMTPALCFQITPSIQSPSYFYEGILELL